MGGRVYPSIAALAVNVVNLLVHIHFTRVRSYGTVPVLHVGLKRRDQVVCQGQPVQRFIVVVLGDRFRRLRKFIRFVHVGFGSGKVL